MGAINVNFEGVGFDPLPTGRYVAALTKYTHTKSTTNKPMIKAEFPVQEGEFAGQTIFMNFVLEKQCLWVLKNYIEAVEGKKIPKQEISVDLDNYFGKKVYIDVDLVPRDDDPTIETNTVKGFAHYSNRRGK